MQLLNHKKKVRYLFYVLIVYSKYPVVMYYKRKKTNNCDYSKDHAWPVY